MLYLKFVRFLISGGVNTFFTYAMYLFLLRFFDYRVSYTASYIFGIVFAWVMARFFVFKSTQGVRSVFLFPFVYAVQFVLSVGVLWGSVEWLNAPYWLAPLLVITVSLPCTYFLSKYLFVGRF